MCCICSVNTYIVFEFINKITNYLKSQYEIYIVHTIMCKNKNTLHNNLKKKNLVQDFKM